MTDYKSNIDLERFGLKVKNILPRFILIAFGTVLSVLLFRWIFSINSNILVVREEVYAVWIPLVFPLIPLILFFLKKAKTIVFNIPGDGTWLFLVIAWLAIVGMLIMSNEYLEKKTGNLIQVGSVDDLPELNAHYVRFDTLKVNGNLGSSYSKATVSGRGGTTYNIDIYFTYLVSSNNKEIADTYWYGSKYNKRISNKLSDEEKSREFQRFYAYAQEHILSIDFPRAHYYEILPYSNERENYLMSVYKIDSFDTKSPVILVPMEGEFNDRTGNTLTWFFVFFAGGIIVLLIIIGFTSIE